jgi:hypothetical protein
MLLDGTSGNEADRHPWHYTGSQVIKNVFSSSLLPFLLSLLLSSSPH